MLELLHNNSWERESTRVQRYGCIPRSAASNLGKIPKNWELQISCFEELLGGENVFGTRPCALTLWDTPVLFTPPLPLPENCTTTARSVLPMLVFQPNERRNRTRTNPSRPKPYLVTLPALQRTFVDSFFELAWEFSVEKWRGFLVKFFWSFRLP